MPYGSPIKYEHGVFYFLPSEDVRYPRQLELGGVIHYRFMDCIYLPQPTHLASKDVVIAANEVRQILITRFPMTVLARNREVKETFLDGLRAANVDSLIEIGPGLEPIGTNLVLEQFAAVDLRPTVRAALARDGIKCVPPEMMSALGANSWDAVAAVFVLHFPFPDSQISATFRALRVSGFMLANLYLLDNPTRSAMAERFRGFGFVLDVLPNLTLGHDLWLLRKGARSSKADALAERIQAQTGLDWTR